MVPQLVSTISLNCLVSGDGPDQIFTVEIPWNENVSILKEMIKEKAALEGLAKAIQLFTVSLAPDEAHRAADPLQIEGAAKLSLPLAKISVVFKDLLDDIVHVVALRPALQQGGSTLKRRREEEPTELRKRSKALQEALEAPAPSSVSKSMKKLSEEQRLRPIYNGRPLTREGPPIVLHEPTFADIQDKLDGVSSMPVDEDLVRDVAELVARAAEIYKDEAERQSQTLPILSKLLNVAMDGFAHANDEGGRKVAESDVIATCNLSLSRHKAILAHFEWKVELGIGGEGSIQGALRLRKQFSADRYEKVRNASKCPCLLVTMAGPYIMFSGFIFSDIYVVQPFTDYISLAGTPSGTKARIRHISEYFSIFREGLRALTSTYQRLEITESMNQIPASCLLPCPSYKPDSNPSSQSLTLLRQYRTDHYDLYEAKYGDASALVKFCETYSEDAHRLLANEGLAPELYYYAELRGGMKMVAMAYDPDTKNAHHAFNGQDLPSSVIEDVRKAISILHEKNIVFGDLRRLNVLVKKVVKSEGDGGGTWCAKLCDFDWTGKEGLGRYSPWLNTKEIHWAQGVERNGVMEKRHDLEMLAMLKTSTVNTRPMGS